MRENYPGFSIREIEFSGSYDRYDLVGTISLKFRDFDDDH